MEEAQLNQFRKSLRVLARKIEARIKNETNCCGVTLAQSHVLLELYDHTGLSLGQLADKLELDKSTLSRTVESLVALGLVERVPSREDRRFVVLSLNESGRERALFIHKGCNDYYKGIFNGLLPEIQERIALGVTDLVGALERKPGSFSGC